MVGTGAAALMAIRVLLDHEVPEVSFPFVYCKTKTKLKWD